MLSSTLMTFGLLTATLRVSDSLKSVSISKKFQTITIKLCAAISDTTMLCDAEVEVSDDPYDIESWRGSYKACSNEIVGVLDGNFHRDLEGTYFRNIFGKFESGKVPILHPFDADGMAVAVTMKVRNHLFMRLIQCHIDIRICYLMREMMQSVGYHIYWSIFLNINLPMRKRYTEIQITMNPKFMDAYMLLDINI